MTRRKSTFYRKFEELNTAAERAAVRLARWLAERQIDLVHMSSKPDGSAQKENKDSTLSRRSKKGKPPLLEHGVFTDIAKWRVTVQRDEVQLRAPAARSGYLRIWKAFGFVTVFDDLPPDISAVWADLLEEETRRG